MLAAIMLTKDTIRARYLLECMEAGVKACGDTTVFVDDYRNYKSLLDKADVGLQLVYPNGRKSSDDAQGAFRVAVNNYMADHGKRILTVDTGFAHSQTEYENEVAKKHGKHQTIFSIDNKASYAAALHKIYYSTCFDGLKRNGDYCTKGKENDESRWDKLQTPLKKWRKRGDHILLIGQTVFGLSSQRINIYDYYRDTVKAIREVTGRRIQFRHHPRIVKIRTGGSRVEKDRNAVHKAMGKPKNFDFSDTRKFCLEEDLENCWAAVGFTSNASVTTVIHGIPTIAGDPSNMAWEVAEHDLAKIEEPDMPKRTQWANKLAWSQWCPAEMISGECWAHLRPHALSKPSYKYEWRN